MRFILGGFLLLVLSGCSEQRWQSLEDFLLSKNIGQEQKNSSKNIDLDWVNGNYPSDCVWYDFERAVDGDTIIVRENTKRIRVRMIGIDTPESKKEGTAIEAFSLEAGERLKDLLKAEARVCLIEDEIGDKYDIYARKLSYVFTESGVDLNAEMLKIGLARAYTRFPFERKQEFIELEQEAKNRSVGRWE